jgi:hypothetical protein
MTYHATGTFEVKLAPQAGIQGSPVMRMSIDKVIQGDLVGTSVGEMLAMGEPTGSGWYVAIERVTGTIAGRSGTFVLMHQGTRTPTEVNLNVEVAPGSGTGDFVGMRGTFTITIVDKQHRYDLEYTL